MFEADIFKHRICNLYNCDRHGIVRRAASFLENSTWFQRHGGRDHVVVSSHWKARDNRDNTADAFKRCNAITFEKTRISNTDRFNIPAFYCSLPCPLDYKKTHDFAMVASMHIERRTHATRSQICKWLPAHNYSTGACGEGDQCPVLAQFRFGFHVRGNTFGANRLFDTMLSGTVPIFTFKEQYDVLPRWVDWESLSYFTNITTEEAFTESLDRILADTGGYKKKLHFFLQHRDMLDWHAGLPFDMFMCDFQRQLFPESDERNGTTYFFPIYPQ